MSNEKSAGGVTWAAASESPPALQKSVPGSRAREGRPRAALNARIAAASNPPGPAKGKPRGRSACASTSG